MDMDYFLITKMIYFLYLNFFIEKYFYLLVFSLLNYILIIGIIKTFERFENFIIKHHKKIVNLDYIINIADPNPIQNIINF